MVLTILMIIGQGPIALAVGAGCLEIFTLLYPFSPLPISGRRPDIDCNTVLKGR